jgi:glutaredoxin
MDQKYTTLAYPATVCMDCQADEITDDEASVETPEVTHKETNKEQGM